MKKLFLVTVSVVALPVVAYAAELPLSMKAPVFAPPPLLTWAGSYVGILGGVAYHRATLNPNCTPDLGCETTELTRTGGTIGTFLGHNWQQGNFVYGFELLARRRQDRRKRPRNFEVFRRQMGRY
ncbi:MAG: hypothetical protein WA753_00555, partial [Pseudolabrys sp.]